MPYTATRDKSNPCWNDLLDHVNKLNDQLVALANFCLGDDVKPPITEDGRLFRATKFMIATNNCGIEKWNVLDFSKHGFGNLLLVVIKMSLQKYKKSSLSNDGMS